MLRLVLMIVVGGALLLISPKGVVTVAENCRAAPLEASLLGLAIGFVIPLMLVLLAFTLIGLPLAVIAATQVAGALYASQALVGLSVGRSLFRLPRQEARRGVNFATLALGVVSISCLRLIPIAGLGVGIAIVTAALGLGAIALTLGGLRQHEIEHVRKRSFARTLFVASLGCLLGLVIAAGVAVTVGASALWLVAYISSTSASAQLTLAFDRGHLALTAMVALIVTLGAGVLGVTIYRRL
jgi:hypothetical protein